MSNIWICGQFHAARILNDYASVLGVDTEVIVAQDGVAIPPKGSVISHTGDSLLNGKPVSKSEIRELLDSLGYVFTDDLKSRMKSRFRWSLTTATPREKRRRQRPGGFQSLLWISSLPAQLPQHCFPGL